MTVKAGESGRAAKAMAIPHFLAQLSCDIE